MLVLVFLNGRNVDFLFFSVLAGCFGFCNLFVIIFGFRILESFKVIVKFISCVFFVGLEFLDLGDY